MTNNKVLEAGLSAIAEDFHLPGGGRKKLSRLVAGHLGWFDAAERRGMSWRDMIGALAAAGVTGKGGRPLSVGTLSSTVWRVRTEKEAGGDKQGRQGRFEPEAIQSQKPSPGKANRRPAAPPRQGGHQGDREVLTGRSTSTSSTRSTDGDRANRGNKEVLAFMDRARTVRRRSEI